MPRGRSTQHLKERNLKEPGWFTEQGCERISSQSKHGVKKNTRCYEYADLLDPWEIALGLTERLLEK